MRMISGARRRRGSSRTGLARGPAPCVPADRPRARSCARTGRTQPRSGFEPAAKLVEPAQDLRRFLQLHQRGELLAHVTPVQVVDLPDDDAFHIDPVLRPVGEGLENDEIFGGTGAEGCVRRENSAARSIRASKCLMSVETNRISSPKPVRSVKSTSTVSRGSPHRWRAMPPMKQNRQPSDSQTAWRSAAARMTAFTGAGRGRDAAVRPVPT